MVLLRRPADEILRRAQPLAKALKFQRGEEAATVEQGCAMMDDRVELARDYIARAFAPLESLLADDGAVASRQLRCDLTAMQWEMRRWMSALQKPEDEPAHRYVTLGRLIEELRRCMKMASILALAWQPSASPQPPAGVVERIQLLRTTMNENLARIAAGHTLAKAHASLVFAGDLEERRTNDLIRTQILVDNLVVQRTGECRHQCSFRDMRAIADAFVHAPPEDSVLPPAPYEPSREMLDYPAREFAHFAATAERESDGADDEDVLLRLLFARDMHHRAILALGLADRRFVPPWARARKTGNTPPVDLMDRYTLRYYLGG